MSDYTHRHALAHGGSDRSSSSSSNNADTSTLQWANSFGNSSLLSSHIMAGGSMEVGDRGEEVLELQTLLGFNKPDGVFGPMTLKQLTLFQGAYGLPESGVLDLPTYARLSHSKQSTTDSNAILFGQVGSGASRGTALQDGLSGGQDDSIKMAQNDEAQILRHKDNFAAVGARHGIPASILAGIASRETRGGNQLNAAGYSVYGGNQGFGMMQVDGGYHTPRGTPDSVEHIEQAAEILVGFRDQLQASHPDWTPAQLLKAAVAAYNCGPGRVRNISNMDGRTTGGDYSGDTWVRAQYYARFFNDSPPTS